MNCVPTIEVTESQAPIIASIDDIDREFAERAFTNTSFYSERRGEQSRKEYADSVNGLYAELWPLAKTNEQKTLLAEEMARYRQGYLSRQKAYLASHANVASAFIVGPARFPVARMQKRSQWADNKANELLEWDRKATAAIKRKLLDSRPQEEKDAQRWWNIQADLQRSLSLIHKIDGGQMEWSNRTAFVNSIAGKVERLALAGDVELTRKAQQLVRSYNEANEKPAISERHKFWTFEELARQSDEKSTAASERELIAQGDGVRIVANAQADRVQIVFDEKPATEMIGRLKGEGWKWSPNAGAWQRKLTEAAKWSARRIVGLV